MLEKNKFNPPCSYSELVIAYFYKEIEASEKNDFEVHLPNCAVCIDELSGFETVHSSISEWRSVEFNHLETPAFTFLPVQSEEFSVDSVSAKNNWWAALRGRYFLPSPIWAAPVFATLLFCFGLAYVFFNSSQNVELAEVGGKDNRNVVLTKIETANNLSVGNNSGSDKFEKSTENVVSKEQQLDVQTNNNLSNASKSRNDVVKVSNNSIRTANEKSNGAKKPAQINTKPGNYSEVRKSPSRKSPNVPFLADIEEVEDDSLRLADLFDDTDAE